MTTTKTKKSTRRGFRRPADGPDLPYTMRLADGRTVAVEIPGRWVTADRGSKAALLPDAVDFLDRVRAVFSSTLDRAPSPGYITRLREGLGMTQAEFGEQIDVDKMTVSRWERGTMRPSDGAVKVIEKLRKQAVRRGVTIEG